MTSRLTLIDGENDKPRDRTLVRERSVQEIPFDELDDVRNREFRALIRPPARVLEPSRRQDDDYYRSRYSSRQDAGIDDRPRGWRRDDQHNDDRQLALRPGRDDYRRQLRSDPGYDDNRRVSKWRDASKSDDSEDDSYRENRRRRRRDRRPHEDSAAQDEDVGPSRRHKSREERKLEEEAALQDDGRLWYSMKNRRDGNWAERNFDSSYDGILAAAAGAALGAITVKHFGNDYNSNRGWKTVGGAVAGAVAFNAGENWYRVFTEEKEERKEKKEKRQALTSEGR